MPLQPRFRHVSGVARPFVDRETCLAAFRQELTRTGHGPRVLNLTGIGGIGKSRLLGELGIQVPPLRQHEAALAVLRAELGRQKVRFDQFDVAYAVLWQRLHPHLKVSRRELPFRDAVDLVSECSSSARTTTSSGPTPRACCTSRTASRSTSRRRRTTWTKPPSGTWPAATWSGSRTCRPTGLSRSHGRRPRRLSMSRCGRSSSSRRSARCAALFAELGRVPEMITSVSWAVREFEATEVYPTMIIGAAAALERLGNPLSEVTAAADRAWGRINGLESTAMMQQRIDRWMSALVTDPR